MAGALAYVFWHRPRSGRSQAAYERRLVGFQESLKGRRPEGFVDALSFRIQARPWSKRRSGGYEDWYLVEDFSALGVLNDAAVVDPNKRPHDEIAKEATGGAGGVYKRLEGELGLRDARFATWIRKPGRTPYQVFFDDLSRLLGKRRTILWRRQMALGRAPEFCLHSERRVDLPVDLDATTLALEVVRARGGPGTPEGS